MSKPEGREQTDLDDRLIRAETYLRWVEEQTETPGWLIAREYFEGKKDD